MFVSSLLRTVRNILGFEASLAVGIVALAIVFSIYKRRQKIERDLKRDYNIKE